MYDSTTTIILKMIGIILVATLTVPWLVLFIFKYTAWIQSFLT